MQRPPSRERLHSSRWLAQTPEDFRRAIVGACQLRAMADGEWLYGADDETGGPFVVLTGAIGMEVPNEAGQQQLNWVIQPGHWIGASSVLLERPRLVSMRALCPSAIAYVPVTTVRRLAGANPGWWRWLGLVAVLNGDLALSVAIDLMRRDARTRVAAILLTLSRSGFVDQATPEPIPLSQGDLARLCGLSRGPMSQRLAELERMGLIRCDYRWLEVLDTAGIRALLNG